MAEDMNEVPISSIPSNAILDGKDILESLDREIAFYRTRIYWVFAYTLATQALVVTGQRTFPIQNKEFSTWLVVSFLAILPVVVGLIVRSLLARLYHYRRERKKLGLIAGYTVYYEPGGKDLGYYYFSPSKIFICAISLHSVLGIAVSFFVN